MHPPESPPHKRPFFEALEDESYKPVVVMGDGQIAMMLVQECHRLGLPVVVIGNGSPKESPKSAVQAMKEGVDYYIDLGSEWNIGNQKVLMDALAEKLKKTGGGVTAEWENVPDNLLAFFLKKGVRLAPEYSAFETMSDKSFEKEFFDNYDILCTKWCSLEDDPDEVLRAKMYACVPGYLKSCTGGYDSKGQEFVKNIKALDEAKRKLRDKGFSDDFILEKKVDLDYEASVVFARDESRKVVILSTQKNHQDGPLISSVAGKGVLLEEVEDQMIAMAIKAANGLDYIGTGAMEFFVTKEGTVLANEMAPRPHNSGHHTIESNKVNQYTLQALIAANKNAVGDILDGNIKGIPADQLEKQGSGDTQYYRTKAKNPDMLTVLINVVCKRGDLQEAPAEVKVMMPGDERIDGQPDDIVYTHYNKDPKNLDPKKFTKQGQLVVQIKQEEISESGQLSVAIRAQIEPLFVYVHGEEKGREYLQDFENMLALAA